MSDDMIALKGNKLPAHLAAKSRGYNPFAAAVSAGGFPVISIKGKVFHIQRGDERLLVTKPSDPDEPASNIEVVIVATNPNRSKVFYKRGYEEGDAGKPDCYSNDGVAPAADAEDPQSKKCALCPHNPWGPRISETGKKGKACADSMRLAVAPPDQPNDPMLLRVPAASLKVLGSYGSQLAKRGVDPLHVITRIGFDYTVAHPALTFKAMRFITAEELEAIEAAQVDEEETILNITGVNGAASAETESLADEPPAEIKRSKELKDAEAEAAAAPKAKVKVEDEDEDEDAPKAKAKAKAKVAPVVEDHDSIDEALDSLDFDD